MCFGKKVGQVHVKIPLECLKSLEYLLGKVLETGPIRYRRYLAIFGP